MGDRGTPAGEPSDRPSAPLAAHPGAGRSRRRANPRSTTQLCQRWTARRRRLAHDRQASRSHTGSDHRPIRPPRQRSRQVCRKPHREPHCRCSGIVSLIFSTTLCSCPHHGRIVTRQMPPGGNILDRYCVRPASPDARPRLSWARAFQSDLERPARLANRPMTGSPILN